jgi:hypothetical protein
MDAESCFTPMNTEVGNLCSVCRQSLEATSDPDVTKRLQPYERDSAVVDDVHDRAGIEALVYAHHRTRQSIEKSAKWGCDVCHSFQQLIDKEPPDGTGDGQCWTSFNLSVDGDLVTMHLKHGDVEEDYKFVPIGKNSAYDTNIDLELSDYTDSPASRASICHWMATCTREHSWCDSRTNRDFLPTRVLRINNVDDPTTHSLVAGSSCVPSSLYNTLSYCWGPKPSKHRLLDTTFACLQGDNIISSLPRTFRDAMFVSARLGIQYLWIDSLCIFQDSKEDWLAEASTMRDVYINSFLTISALSGADNDAGLFHTRDPAKLVPTIVNLKLSSICEPIPYRTESVTGGTWSSWKTDSDATARRGWCLQERLLSPRTLHFGRTQLYWECREKCFSEVNPESVYNHRPGLEPFEDPAERPRIWKQLIGGTSSLYLEDPAQELYHAWYSMVQVYGFCALTVPSDKLVAIAGLANDMKEAQEFVNRKRHHNYLMGLWQDDISQGLCWERYEGATRSAHNRAPSWTWACMNGRIGNDHRYRRVERVPLIDPEDVEVSGIYESTTLSLLGRLLQGHVKTIRRKSSLPISGEPRCVAHSLASGGNSPASADCRSNLISRNIVKWDSDDPKEQPEEVLLLPLQLKKDNTHTGPQMSIVGLVLAPVGQYSTLFRRLGLFESRSCWSVDDQHLAEESLERFAERRVMLI